MKHWLTMLLLFCLFVFTGCSTVSSRIAANPAAYNQLSPADQALVRQGRIREGMGQEPVFLAWGKPDTTSEGSALGHSYENWAYLAYTTYPWPNYGFGPGWFRGDWGYYPFYELNYPTWGYPYKTATFVRGKVVAWSAADWP